VGHVQLARAAAHAVTARKAAALAAFADRGKAHALREMLASYIDRNLSSKREMRLPHLVPFPKRSGRRWPTSRADALPMRDPGHFSAIMPDKLHPRIAAFENNARAIKP